MLGIRRYRGVAIDLFQGSPDLFEVDAMIDPGELPPEELYEEALVAAFAGVDARGSRHCAIRPELDGGGASHGRGEPADQASWRQERAHLSMVAVRQFLDGERTGATVKRITFLLPDKAWYTAFRDALFASFADTP